MRIGELCVSEFGFYSLSSLWSGLQPGSVQSKASCGGLFLHPEHARVNAFCLPACAKPCCNQCCQIGPDFTPNLVTLGLPDWAGNQGRDALATSSARELLNTPALQHFFPYLSLSIPMPAPLFRLRRLAARSLPWGSGCMFVSIPELERAGAPSCALVLPSASLLLPCLHKQCGVPPPAVDLHCGCVCVEELCYPCRWLCVLCVTERGGGGGVVLQHERTLWGSHGDRRATSGR